MKIGKIYISCTNYPNCKKFMNMPKGIKALEMMGYACKNCKERNDIVSMKFTIVFYNDIFNDEIQ